MHNQDTYAEEEAQTERGQDTEVKVSDFMYVLVHIWRYIGSHEQFRSNIGVYSHEGLADVAMIRHSSHQPNGIEWEKYHIERIPLNAI